MNDDEDSWISRAYNYCILLEYNINMKTSEEYYHINLSRFQPLNVK